MRGPRPGGREARGGRGRGPVLPAGLFRENSNVKGHLHGLCDFKFRLPQVQLRLRDVCAFFYFPHVCGLGNAFPKCVRGGGVFCGCAVVSVWADRPIIHGVLRGL